ncbi:hypothetical protein KA478_03205 [Patescibacteria group bacterium]|nr:hypothetical protein [Patescibacteria group bacterium]
MTSLKQAYDKIESIAQSGKTLSISLVDTAMLNKEFAKIKKAGQASSGQIARIEPYMSFNHVMSFLKESGESDSQRNRALISIILVILSLHAIYPVWALVSLKRNKKDQTGELGAQFNELDKQHARLQAMLMQLLPAFVNSRNYDEMQELGKATLGSSEAFNGLMASVLQ